MTNDNEESDSIEDEMTEQIEADFGGMHVYVSSDDAREAREHFAEAWSSIAEMYDETQELRDHLTEMSGGSGPSRTFD